MKPLRDTAAALTIGASLVFAPLPATAAKSIKIPSSVSKRVGDVFRSTGKSGAVTGTDKSTRLAHTLYATIPLAQLAALDEKKMDDMAYRYYLSEKSKAEESGKLLDPEKDPTGYRVREITRRILKSIRENPEYRERYQEIKTDITGGNGWKIMTIQNPILNAYCLPGGRMVVYSGLAEKLTDDELAVVIGHEIMHAMKGHSYNTAKDHLMRQAALFAGAAAVGAKSLPVSMTVLGEAFATGTVFSRRHEREADITGLHVSHDAGYDTHAAISLWRKMDQSQKGGQPPEILSSHPSHSTREQYLREEIAKMKN